MGLEQNARRRSAIVNGKLGGEQSDRFWEVVVGKPTQAVHQISPIGVSRRFLLDFGRCRTCDFASLRDLKMLTEGVAHLSRSDNIVP